MISFGARLINTKGNYDHEISPRRIGQYSEVIYDCQKQIISTAAQNNEFDEFVRALADFEKLPCEKNFFMMYYEKAPFAEYMHSPEARLVLFDANKYEHGKHLRAVSMIKRLGDYENNIVKAAVALIDDTVKRLKV